MSQTFEMPRPRVGDVVLFSTDVAGFTEPTIAWVTGDRGAATVNLLAFGPGGFVQKTSVHHRDDPGLKTEPGWAELGAWDFAPLTLATYKAATHAQAKPAGK